MCLPTTYLHWKVSQGIQHSHSHATQRKSAFRMPGTVKLATRKHVSFAKKGEAFVTGGMYVESRTERKEREKNEAAAMEQDANGEYPGCGHPRREVAENEDDPRAETRPEENNVHHNTTTIANKNAGTVDDANPDVEGNENAERDDDKFEVDGTEHVEGFQDEGEEPLGDFDVEWDDMLAKIDREW